MPFADNNGVRIHYEVEGDGPPLVLIHGFLADLEYWRLLGYIEALNSNYRVVSIDMRGHGQSDKPHEPEDYGETQRVGDILAILDAEGVQRAHVWGYSMGGTVGFLLAYHAPDRVASLITGGIAARSTASQPATIKLLEAGVEAVVQVFTSGTSMAAFASRVATIDRDALLACAHAPGRSLDDIHSRILAPCLMYVGENDVSYATAPQTVQTMPNAKFVGLPGLNHLEGWARSDLVLPHVTAFLAQVAI
jgi:pimeloyl-ACP methyl ester carboxylesterase